MRRSTEEDWRSFVCKFCSARSLLLPEPPIHYTFSKSWKPPKAETWNVLNSDGSQARSANRFALDEVSRSTSASLRNTLLTLFARFQPEQPRLGWGREALDCASHEGK